MRVDGIGTSIIVLGILLDLYLATFIKTSVMIFPSILLLGGLVFSRFFESIKLESKGSADIWFNTFFGFGMVGLIAYLMPKLFIGSILDDKYGISIAVAFYGLMAISEEVFFRGFLQGFFKERFNSSSIAIVMSALLWSVYHISVYGQMPGLLMYILFVGLIFGWIDEKTNSLTPSLIVHLFVNLMAGMG